MRDGEDAASGKGGGVGGGSVAKRWGGSEQRQRGYAAATGAREAWLPRAGAQVCLARVWRHATARSPFQSFAVQPTGSAPIAPGSGRTEPGKTRMGCAGGGGGGGKVGGKGGGGEEGGGEERGGGSSQEATLESAVWSRGPNRNTEHARAAKSSGGLRSRPAALLRAVCRPSEAF